MRRILQILAAAVLFLGELCPGAVPRDSMVRVYRGSSAGSGTIVHASRDGRWRAAITCWHVLRDDPGRPIYVQTRYGKRAATLVAADAHNDMAVLSFQDQSPPAPWATRYEGQRYTVAGFGSGSYGENSGRFLRTYDDGEMCWTAVARSGDSGGGLFDEQGRLVGVVWGNAADGHGGAFTKNVSRMTALLNKTQCRNTVVRQANMVCGPQGCYPQDPMTIQPIQTPPAQNGGVSPPLPGASAGSIQTVTPPAQLPIQGGMICVPIVSPTPYATYQQAETIKLQLQELQNNLQSLRGHLGNR